MMYLLMFMLNRDNILVIRVSIFMKFSVVYVVFENIYWFLKMVKIVIGMFIMDIIKFVVVSVSRNEFVIVFRFLFWMIIIYI